MILWTGRKSSDAHLKGETAANYMVPDKAMRNGNSIFESMLTDSNKKEEDRSGQDVNHLFPVFLKLANLRVLLIGAGNVGLEKLNAILTNAPATSIKVVARDISPSFYALAAPYPGVEIIQTEYAPAYLDTCDIVIVAVDDPVLSARIRKDAKEKGKLMNAADKPEFCDFYLASVVTKGNLKVAISTNGKSPTIAKRLKEVLNELLPEELDEILVNLQQIREKLKGDFQQKVQRLNDITRILVEPATGDD